MSHHRRSATDICVLTAVPPCGPFCLTRSVRAYPTHRTYGDTMRNTVENAQDEKCWSAIIEARWPDGRACCLAVPRGSGD